MLLRIVSVVGFLLLVPPSLCRAELPFGQELLKGLGQTLGSGAGPREGKDGVPLVSTPESAEEEIAVGRQIAGNLLGAAPLVKDKELQKYVNLVGRWVANQSERPDLPWHFGVIDSDDINAFAAPGGYILVTRGLYLQLANEAQLAGVLAHEVGHVVQQHHYQVIRKARVVDFGSKLLGSKVGRDNPLVQNLIGSGAEIVARGLDKSAEYEADRMGMVLSARAGYDQYALVEVLQQMGHYGKEDDAVKLLFKTHPHPDQRLEHLDASVGDRLDHLHGQTVAERFYRLKK
ncbi:MAG: M48 family metalloprotease [Desulfobulbaceae bacterium]|nr:M48 family metalloprotease [Desulfobulbaceae bacterium]